MASKTNSTEKAEASLGAAARLNNTEVVKKEAKRVSVADSYKKQSKVAVTGAPMYRAYFGNLMPIIINGVRIDVPLDGRKYEVPKAFARIFNARIRSVNDQLAAQKAMSDVQSNHEQYPGALDLVRSL